MSDALRLPPQPPHAPASAVSAAVALLGLFGLMDRLGLTADDVAAILGGAMAFVSAIYAWRSRQETE